MKEAEEKAARAEGGDFSFILDETRGHTVMTDSEFERLKEETSVKAPKLSSYHGNNESDFATTEEDEDEQGFGGLAGCFSRKELLGSKKRKKWFLRIFLCSQNG